MILRGMEQPERWAVVLAGGEGSRMRPFIESWLGRHLPKQYCAFKGTRTMIEHTMTRAVDAVGAEKIVTVIGSGHWRHLDEPRRLEVPGRIVEQPENRETGPGLFLGLSWVMAADPEALVAVLPSDHYVSSRRRFATHLRRAFALAGRLPENIVLLGVRPDRPETSAPLSGVLPPARKDRGGHRRAVGPKLLEHQALLASAHRALGTGGDRLLDQGPDVAPCGPGIGLHVDLLGRLTEGRPFTRHLTATQHDLAHGEALRSTPPTRTSRRTIPACPCSKAGRAATPV